MSTQPIIHTCELERILTESGCYSPGGKYTAIVSDRQGNVRFCVCLLALPLGGVEGGLEIILNFYFGE